MTVLRRLYRRLTGPSLAERIAPYGFPQIPDARPRAEPTVWTCPLCHLTNAHASRPTLRCKGKRP